MFGYELDRERQWAPDSRQNWGDLLKAVERRLRLRGRIVTVVRFAGVVQPSFRDHQDLQRGLATMGRIEIESSSASRLLADTMTTARESIGLLETTITRVALTFREDPEAATRELVELVEAVRALTVLTGAMADVITLETGRATLVRAADITAPVGAALRALRAWQAVEDWSRTAICLEEELRPAIRRWHALFDRLEEQREAA
ncbi:MAG: hypothetical protein AB7N65_00940 [Vicinamibacterales bacterium]